MNAARNVEDTVQEGSFGGVDAKGVWECQKYESEAGLANSIGRNTVNSG